ncbi:CdaR family transcriptional regulator [Bifidobacterium samirii]|uniref:Sugar diacid recognition n=1 Tax=Bifidobacterium samirii TaxID=2306974 RepID=A0A430FWC2_9BIFI|nr:sugar diacid recognition domain-containing protein [Bifidobacterium samirii]RSX58491.1 sugar diacid recognition [Bifidobacterium samirii]
MHIDQRIAQTIVESIKGIISHDINFFDTDGVMTASTDLTRIGSFHDAARLAARTKRTVAVDHNAQFAGARSGVNAPVMLGDQVVAVIGITGERHDVEPFGNVIRRMTEILVRENLDQMTRFDQRMMQTNLVNLLTAEQHDPSLVEYLASSLHVDLHRPRRVAVGRCTSKDASSSGRDGLYTVLGEALEPSEHTLHSVSTQGFCILLDAAPDEPEPEPLLESLRGLLERELGRGISIGIGGVRHDADRYWTSHRQATTAVDWLRFTERSGVLDYDDLGYGLLVSSMPADEADRFIASVFAGVADADIDAYRAVFDAYTRNNGAIGRAADELFLHKNTLQNRLNTIARRTGYNPRDLEDHAVLAAAFLLRDYLRFQRASRGGTRSYADDTPGVDVQSAR